MALTKNQMVEISITGTTAEGNGVGRFLEEGETGSGIAVFVPYTAIGDRIRCRIQKVQKHHAYGRVVELLSPSEDRLAQEGEADDCAVFGQCGGCTWRHIRYEAELRYKWQQVADAFKRLGGLSIVPEPIVGSPLTSHYRNKAQYPVAQGPNGLRAGFYAPRSHRVVGEGMCPLQPAEFSTIVQTVLTWAKKSGVTAYDETTGQGLLRHIYIRKAEVTGEIMVCLVCTSGKLPQAHTLIEVLRTAVPAIASIVVNLNRADTNVILGETEFVLWGQDAIVDELCGLRFSLSARSFYQVNRRQAETLYGLVAQAADLHGTETLLDLYCGTGTIGLSMATKAKQLIGVEVVEPAVADARSNAQRNHMANARFLCADAAKAAKQLQREGIRPDVVVMDPPRRGCDEAVLQAIAEMAPSRLVYVSCNPATLARDLARLEQEGYTVQKAVPVDMFPRTAHVETVVLMSKVKE